MKLDTQSFEEAWRMYLSFGGQAFIDDHDLDPESLKMIFFSGGLMCISVLSNRMSELPGQVEPSEMIKALVDTMASSIAELGMDIGSDNLPAGHA